MKSNRIHDAVSRRDVLRLLGVAGMGAFIRADLRIAERYAWQSPLRVNGTRVDAHLASLSEFGKNPQGGVSRVAYSDADIAARKWVMGLMRDAGLDPSIDAAGNIIGRRAGRDATRKPILFGSHIDSVPEGGNYDGDVGSMGAIEVAQTLFENKVTLRHPIEVTIWQNEEGGLTGSRALSGGSEEKGRAPVSQGGKTIREGIAAIGGDVSKLASVRRQKGDIAGYVELHIEQGGILDATKTDIGVVEGIVGIDRWDVTIEGFANHAGTTPMDQRHDAMLAAARFVTAVNQIVTSIPGRQVGTVGRLTAYPGAPNVIPGKVVLTLELRDLDAAKTKAIYQRIVDESKSIGARNGTTFSFAETNIHLPALTDPRFQKVITA